MANVTIDARADVPVEFIDVLLEGTDEIVIRRGNANHSFSHPLLSLGARVHKGGTLSKGQVTLPCRFTVPKELPPSYRGKYASCSYTLTVHVAIPWWPDRKAAFDIKVRAPRVAPPEQRSTSFGSHPQGPKGDELTLECSLAGRVLEPEGILEGAIALGNLAFHRVRYLSVGLCGIETVREHGHRRSSEVEAETYSMRLPVSEELGDGDSIPFRMRLPDRINPSWESVLWKLAWYLDVQAHVLLGRDVTIRIPLTIVPHGSAPKDRKAPPVIGSERVMAVWSDVARSLGLEIAGESMRTRAHGTDIVIRREHRGDAGIFLVAELSFPSLHLGLDGGLRRGFRRILGGGVESGHAAWDRRHYVAARHPAQFGPVLKAIAPSLTAVDLYDIDDEQALLQSREAGLTTGPLRAFAAKAIEVARAIDRARRHVPPPPGMEGAMPAWQLVADKLEGSLETARMAVNGRIDGAPVEIITLWDPDGSPSNTTIRTVPTVPPREEQLVEWRAGAFARGGLEGLPEPCRELVERVLDGSLRLSIDEREVVLVRPAPMTEAGLLLEAAHGVVGIAASLHVGAGPYR